MIERKPVFENLASIWERRKEKIKLRTKKPEYPFGLPILDNIVHGITKGKVTVIAGRTSEAKTAFTLQAAFRIADAGKTVVYITLEDDSEQISERIFSNLASVDNQDLIRGSVPHDVLDNPTILNVFGSIKFLAMENYGHNFHEIQEVIQKADPKPDLVFLDYVQMIEQKSNETEYEALSRFSQACKRFAELHDIGLVVVSQINRAGAKEGRPQAHHLQGCGRLEQVSDLLLILYCPFNYKDSSFDFEEDKVHGVKFVSRGMEQCPADYVEVIVAKNKNGMRNRVVPLRFTGKYYRFEEWKDETVRK